MPDPDADDHTMFGSVGSGVAHPLSPPPTWCHIPRGIPVMRRWALDAAVTGAPVRGLVLLVAEHVVRDRVVHGHVVHLRVREALAEPRLAAIDRDREALVVGDDHAVGVGVVDPHVVMIAGRARGAGG